jgi:uncharacterized protein (TIGR03435 family)
MQSTDDSALLRDYVKNHSDDAFAALVTRHINLVYSVAMRAVGDPHGAEEITQAVFIILAKKAAQLRSGNALSSWLFQTTRLTAGNFLRSEMRRHRREQEAHMQMISDGPEPDLGPEITPLLDNAVAALNEKDRRAILLRFYEGKNLSEIGAVLSASEAAAEKRVLRAVGKIRKFFVRRGVHSTTEAITDAIAVNVIQPAPVMLAKAVTAMALAKGATASTSTLTLIKGALKMMAWTKTKTVVVAVVVAALAMGTTTIGIRAWLFPAIKDAYFQPNYRQFQKLPDGLFVLRSTHFSTPLEGVDYSAETSGKSGQHATWMMGRNRSFEQLMARAYACPLPRIVFPTDVPNDHFDYLSTILDDRAADRLQTAITKKLGYSANWKDHDATVFLLKVRTPDSSALKPADPASRIQLRLNPQRQYVFSNRPVRDLGFTIADAANVLVDDETGLTNSFDFVFESTASDLAGHDWDKVNLALDRLGLELVPTNMPVRMLVVEKVP